MSKISSNKIGGGGGGGSSGGSGIASVIASGTTITPTDLTVKGNGIVDVSVAGTTLTINGTAGGGVTDHGLLTGLSDDDHTQYLLRDDVAASGAANKPTVSGTDVGAGNQLWVSGIPVGNYLGVGGVSDHGLLTGLTDDDHPQYLLRDDFPASGNDGSIPLSGTVIGASSEVYVSGVPVGHYLSTDHGGLAGLTDDDHTQYLLRDDFAASGNNGGVPLSGTTVGAASQMYVSGVPVGDYLTPAGTGAGSPDGSGIGSVISSGTQTYPTDLTVEGRGTVITSLAGSTLTVSGIATSGPATDHGTLSGLGDDDHPQYLLRAAFASSGAAAKPTTSGTNVGAGSQLWVSGVPVGDYLSAGGGGADGSGIGAVTASGSSIYPANVTVAGQGTVVTSVAGSTLTISGIASAAGGGNPVDSRAVSGDIIPDANYSYDLGATNLGFKDVILDGKSNIAIGASGNTNDVIIKKNLTSAELQFWNGPVSDYSAIKAKNINATNLLHADNNITLGAAITFNNKAAAKGLEANILEVRNSNDTASGSLRASSGIFYDQVTISGVNVGDYLSPTAGGGSDGSGIGSVISSGTQTYPTDLTVEGQGTVVTSLAGSTLTISGIAGTAGGGNPVDSRAATGDIIPDTNHIYDIGNDGSGWNNVYANSGTFSSGFIAGSGQVIGELVVGDVTNSVRINESTRSIEFYEGAIKRALLFDGGLEWKTGAYVLWGSDAKLKRNAENDLLIENGAGVSGTFTGGSGVFAKQVTISGVNVGDYLSTTAGGADGSGVGSIIASGSTIYPSDLTVDGAGTVKVSVAGSTMTISGIAGAGGGVTDHGLLTGLADDDHTQYLLRADFAASGNNGGVPLSGTTVGAASQMYISGVAVGDFLGGGGGASDGSGVGSIIASGSTIYPSDLTIAGAGTVTASVAGSTLTISGIAGGGGSGSPVDSRAATGDILVDTSGAYMLGSKAKPFASGAFDSVVLLASGDGSAWRMRVNTDGSLYTESI